MFLLDTVHQQATRLGEKSFMLAILQLSQKLVACRDQVLNAMPAPGRLNVRFNFSDFVASFGCAGSRAQKLFIQLFKCHFIELDEISLTRFLKLRAIQFNLAVKARALAGLFHIAGQQSQ